MDGLPKLKDILALELKQVFLVAVVTWTLLLLPRNIAEFFGINGILSAYKPAIGLLAIVAPIWIVVEWGYGKFERIRSRYERKKQRINALHQLTPEECEFLRPFIRNERRTQISVGDMWGAELEEKDIVYQSDTVEYSIKPWAYEYLQKHPELLEHDNP